MFRKFIFYFSIIILGGYFLWLRGDLPEVKSLLESRTAGTPRFRAFNKGEFDELLRNGNKIVILVSATWDAESVNQRQIVRTIFNSSKYNEFVLYDMDYDLNRADLPLFFVSRPATVLVFAHGQEISRVTGTIKAEELDKALGPLKARTTRADVDHNELEFAIKQAK